MTVSRRDAAISGLSLGQWAHFTPPYCIPPGIDLGGGGVDAIVVMVAGSPVPAFVSGSYPAGYGYPAYPTLTGSENWMPVGFHGYSRVKFSPKYGIIVSNMAVLAPSGQVVSEGHACFNVHENDPTNGERKWRYMGRHPDNWYTYFEYDWLARRDLVSSINNDDRLYVLNGALAGLPGALPTLGALVWQGDGAFVASGKKLSVPNGHNSIWQVPWRNEFWIYQGNISQLYRINLTTGGWENLNVPTSIFNPAVDRAQFCPDPVGQRMLFIRADLSVAPDTSYNGVPRYPAKVYACTNLSAPNDAGSWVLLGTSTRLIANPGAPFQRAFMHQGGARFTFMDVWDGATDVGGQIPYTVGGFSYKRSQGGFYPIDFYVPPASKPRTLTCRKDTIPAGTYTDSLGRVYSRRDWNGQKHSDMAYNPLQGRMWHSGGDILNNFPTGSGNSSIRSFPPENIADFVVECPHPVEGSRPVYPKLTDQAGFRWRGTDSCFWWNAAQNYPDDSRYSCPGWEDVYDATPGTQAQKSAAQHAAWLSHINTTFGYSITDPAQIVWRLNPVTKVFTPFAPVATGYPATLSAVWTQGESRKSFKWDWDPSTDRLCQITRNLKTNAGTLAQDEPVCMVYNPTNNTFDSAACSYDEANGVAISSSSMGDYSTMNPANGRVYFYDFYFGYIFRVDVRAGTYTRDGKPHFHTRRVCTLVPHWRSINLLQMGCMKGVLFFMWNESSGRSRMFSFKDDGSETKPLEHDVPPFFSARTLGTYTSGPDERLCCVGASGQGHPTYPSTINDIWTMRF